MKKRYFVIMLLLAGVVLCFFACHSNPEKKRLAGTVWQSQSYESLFTKRRITIALELRFYEDSVTFDLPHSLPEDVAELLGSGAAGKVGHYSWDYKIDNGVMELDPGMMGYAVPLELSGDSLIWKGDQPLGVTQLVLRKVP